jgi:hypothetical protein
VPELFHTVTFLEWEKRASSVKTGDVIERIIVHKESLEFIVSESPMELHEIAAVATPFLDL